MPQAQLTSSCLLRLINCPQGGVAPGPLSTQSRTSESARPGAVQCHIRKSFYDIISAQNDRRWQFQAEFICSLLVDHKLKLGRLRDRQIGGICAFKDLRRVDAELPIGVDNARSVIHRPAGGGEPLQR